jgi:hypothetical protein
MLYANPNKNEGNLDVITTVNFSYGQGTTRLLANLLNLTAPPTFYQVIKDLNDDAINSDKQVFYGVMGLEGDPQLHPWADASKIGQPCSTAADCGDPSGNVCADFGNGEVRCGVVALSQSGCPTSSKFYNLAVGDTIQLGGCF